MSHSGIYDPVIIMYYSDIHPSSLHSERELTELLLTAPTIYRLDHDKRAKACRGTEDTPPGPQAPEASRHERRGRQ